MKKALIVLAILAMAASAVAEVKYHKPKGEEDYLNPNPKLTLAAPRHVGYSSIANPVLWFNASLKDKKIRFTMVKQGSSEALTDVILSECSNVMCAVELPAGKTTLEPGVSYEWTLAYVDVEPAVVTTGAIKYVPCDREFSNYKEAAEAGYWYDAVNFLYNPIQEAVPAQPDKPKGDRK